MLKGEYHSTHILQEFILMEVLVGKSYTPEKGYETIEEWKRTEESKLLVSLIKETPMKETLLKITTFPYRCLLFLDYILALVISIESRASVKIPFHAICICERVGKNSCGGVHT
ncbi:hypothetical protein [Bacillus altitudinis]|uniref:hypothetical protein n=1 Tax=Bacillus altitudinis TaxID=293387 RepID=UPI003CE92A4C